MFSLADWSPVFISLKTATIAVIGVTLMGLPLAMFMARREFPGKDLLESAITLPMVLPPSVIGYGLLMLIGKNGLLGQVLENLDISIIFTWWAAALAATVCNWI